METKSLIDKAITAMQKSYSPYSEFKVGAALLCKNGSVYSGCNIENSAYSCTVCAERTAIFKAINDGEMELSAIAVVGGKNGIITDFCSPCGVCRQVMSEFCNDDFQIILWNGKQINEFTLNNMLPERFGYENLMP